MIDYPKPLIGFCAFSGTGKTTLLAKLLPLLTAKGLGIAVIKHAHHDFDLDYPGKDSHTLRKAGASQLVITSRLRQAFIREFNDGREEPELPGALKALDPDGLDLVIVEGFKHEPFRKIELYRPALRRPLMCHEDENIIAVATDAPVEDLPEGVAVLDLNRPEQIAEFVLQAVLPTAPAG
jgi:molybdopterin-guanine dinucleotide biosynthesis protein MobB